MNNDYNNTAIAETAEDISENELLNGELSQTAPAPPKKSPSIKIAGRGTFMIVALFGGYIVNTLYISLGYLLKGTAAAAKFLWRYTRGFVKKAAGVLKKIVVVILRPFVSMLSFFEKTFISYKQEKERNGGRATLGSVISFIGKVLFGKSGIAVIVFNCAIPVISVFFLFSVITYASSLNYAVKLSVNGKFMGYIENEQVFLDAKEVLKERVNYLGSDMEIEAVPSYSIEQIGYTETLTKYQIADLILQNSGVSLEYGYGFFINDVFYGALLDFTNVRNVLEGMLQKYETGSDSETVNFVDNIKYDEAGLYLSESIIDENWLIDLLTGTKQESSYYLVEDGDSQSLIADKVDLTTSQLEALNPGFSELFLHTGDRIKISSEVPFLSVKITRTEVYTVGNVPFSSESYQDSDMYEGMSRIVQEGVYGENEVTADVTYVNGIETGRNITKVISLSLPVTEITAIGIKPSPAGSIKGGSAAYGKLMWPVDSGYISQWTHWEGGYSGHVGIDIAGVYYGQPVYAGASGIVTYAGWSQSLGYYVQIYHEDLGISSIYAHNSILYVSKGQWVAQGECIAGAGSTGWSTGMHVHIGVQVNGTPVNPHPFLDIPSYVGENIA